MKTRRHAVAFLRGITLAIALSLAPAATLWADSPKAAAPSPSMAAVQSTYGQLPLSFEANEGQTDTRVQFLTRGRGHTLFLTPSDAVLAFRTGDVKGEGRQGDAHLGQLSNNPPPTSPSMVRMTFEGANPQAEVVGIDKLPGIVNYLIGGDPSTWRTNIPTYKKVEYMNVYPGIDLVYYGNQGQLEYDLIVAPGADPNLIRLVFDGAEKIEVDPATGDLVLTVSEPSANSELRTEKSALPAGATLRLHKPVVYQLGDHDDKHLLVGTYVLLVSEISPLTPHVAFEVASYDASKPLIIDPVLSWATYLGGSGFDGPYGDGGGSIAVDVSGNAYVTGLTVSTDFPTTLGTVRTTFAGGNYDAFVTKLNPTGSALVYSTYLGGNSNEVAFGIAVDVLGNAYVTGRTGSFNFPITAGAFQTVNSGYDVFVTKLNPTGSALVYSTYLGGSSSDVGSGIAVDALPNPSAYVTGYTLSNNFPVTLGAFQTTFGGEDDVFVAKISFTPTANAGADQAVPEGALVTLDGTGSSGGSLTYSWTKVAGPSVALTGATTAHPTFTAPNVPAVGDTVTFELVVCEGTSSICSEPDSVNVKITDVNHPPVSQAGPDQTVQEGSPVNLDGTASYDPDMDTLTYQWSQILGPAVTLMNPAPATASFTAPSVAVGGATLEFDLTVKDPHNLTGSDKVSVVVKNVNQPPVANAGPDQTKNEQTLVTLDGSASNDPDLDTLGYTWTQTGGPAVVLAGASTASPTFTAPEVTVGGALLTFQLTANDGQINSSVADTVQIKVQNVNDPPVCALAQASPNLLWPPNHTMTQVSITGITDPDNNALTITYTSVKQDEPINGLGDGDTSPDAIESGNKILLRAERAGTGNGRVYVVQFTAADPAGAQCSGTVRVSVPHDKKDSAVEGLQLYNSFGP